MGSNLFFTKDYIKLPYCKIGDFTYGKPTIIRWGDEGKVIIGKYCSISEEVKFILAGEHRKEWVTTYPFTSVKVQKQLQWMKPQPYIKSRGDIIVENDIWIGYGSTILENVTIGNGAIIGAQSVVSKNVNPYEIVVGNPARVVKLRFSEDIIKKLLKIKWWEWDIDKIKKNVELMKDIKRFIEVHYTN